MDYDPYGRDVANGAWSTSTRFRFAGGPRDAQDLYRFGERYYDPQIGRWTQLDSLRQDDDLRQANRYSYAGDDPINLKDPSGLATCLGQEFLLGAGFAVGFMGYPGLLSGAAAKAAWGAGLGISVGSLFPVRERCVYGGGVDWYEGGTGGP